MRVSVTPAPAHVGQAITYRATLRAQPGVGVRFEPPQSGGSLTWSHVRAGREKPGWLTRGFAGG